MSLQIRSIGAPNWLGSDGEPDELTLPSAPQMRSRWSINHAKIWWWMRWGALATVVGVVGYRVTGSRWGAAVPATVVLGAGTLLGSFGTSGMTPAPWDTEEIARVRQRREEYEQEQRAREPRTRQRSPDTRPPPGPMVEFDPERVS